MSWHVRYFQQEKEGMMAEAAEIMHAAGFDNPTIGEHEVIGVRGDVTAFIGAIWQKDGAEGQPPFWTIVMVAAGGDTAAAVKDLEAQWGKHWYTPVGVDQDKYD